MNKKKTGQPNLKEDALRLFKQYETYKDNVSLRANIKHHEIGNTVSFASWIKSKNPDEKRGYSLENVTLKQRLLKEIANAPTPKTERVKRTQQKRYKDALDLFSYAEQYLKTERLAHKPGHVETELQIPEHNNFAGCRWYVFFLYYRPDYYHMEPVLGRAIVNVHSNGKIDFINTDQPESVNYEGSCLPFNTSKDLVIFNFWAKERDGRQLHIKLSIRSKKQKVAVGMYLTYEHHRSQAGKIVFVRMDEPFDALSASAFALFQKEKKYEAIPPEIKDFLSVRNHNYYLLKEGVTDFETLKTKLDFNSHSNVKSLRFCKDALFLEKSKPKVFISFPLLGNKKDSRLLLKDIRDDIKEALKDKVEVFSYLEHGGGNKHIEPFESLEMLKSTRFFIFFADELDTINYSLIQLGFAFGVSKKIILVGRKNKFSETLYRIEKDKPYNFLKIIWYDNSSNLKSEWDNGKRGKVFRSIVGEIRNYLPESLGGSIKIDEM